LLGRTPDLERFTPTVKHDPEADAVYVRLAEGATARTLELDDLRMVDIDDRGTVLGVELLEVSGGVDLRDVPDRDVVMSLLRDLPVRVVAA
jgi:uncharacterized protein YuzE